MWSLKGQRTTVCASRSEFIHQTQMLTPLEHSIMRLLNTKTWDVEEFGDASTPEYAVLSHCWSSEEILMSDLDDIDTASRKAGFAKLRSGCQTAIELGAAWLWIDAICIDQSSLTELSEAVNSHFHWFRSSQFCIAHLDDIDQADGYQGHPDQLRASRWMTRSWTLPELIAPKDIRFYGNKWIQFGTKETLLSRISEITGVDQAVLRDADNLPSFSAGRKMCWAASRSTFHTEDVAYSLLGIFSIRMAAAYGEGREAFFRLQERILQDTRDASVVMWQAVDCRQHYRGIFAHSPQEFIHFAAQSLAAPFVLCGETRTDFGAVTLQSAYVVDAGDGQIGIGFPRAHHAEKSLDGFGILLKEWDGAFVRSNSWTICALTAVPEGSIQTFCVERDVDTLTSDTIYEDTRHTRDHLRSLGSAEGGHLGLWGEEWDISSLISSCHLRQLPMRRAASVGNSLHLSNKAREDFDIWSANNTELAQAGNLDTTGIVLEELKLSQLDNSFDEDALSAPSEGDTSSSGNSDNAESSSDSFEDDIHLLVSLPPPRPTLDPNHAFTGLIDELTTSALDEFIRPICLGLPPFVGKRSGSSLASPRSKRQRLKLSSAIHTIDLEQETDPSDDDTVLVRKQTYSIPPPAFACPYYLWDPAMYRSCLTRAHLPDLSALKQHLGTSHRRPPFCPICKEVFTTSGAFEKHIRARECSVQPGPGAAGITTEQVALLARRADPNLSADEQWFAVWDIVFPKGSQRPAYTRLTGEMERSVGILRDWWGRKGRVVVAQFLEGHGLAGYEVQDEEAGLEALYAEVLDRMADAIVDGFQVGEHPGAEVCAKIATALRSVSVWLCV